MEEKETLAYRIFHDQYNIETKYTALDALRIDDANEFIEDFEWEDSYRAIEARKRGIQLLTDKKPIYEFLRANFVSPVRNDEFGISSVTIPVIMKLVDDGENVNIELPVALAIKKIVDEYIKLLLPYSDPNGIMGAIRAAKDLQHFINFSNRLASFIDFYSQENFASVTNNRQRYLLRKEVLMQHIATSIGKQFSGINKLLGD